MEDFLIFASVVNFILIIVMTIVFFVMAANISKIKRKVTGSESTLRRDALMYEFLGEKDKAIRCYEKVKFIIKNDGGYMQHQIDSLHADIDNKIKALQD